MSYLNRKMKSLIILLLGMLLIGCTPTTEETANGDLDFNKKILRLQQFPQTSPKDYKLIDWSERAIAFDELVFDQEKDGLYLPLIWDDEQYNSFGLPAYVGDGRMHQNGAQEAVTNIAAVLSATLNGIDKSAETDYVEQLSAFYSAEEEIILNNPAGSSATTSMWYLLYPTILFAHVSDLYENHVEIRMQLLTAIESWYQAYEIMYNDGNPNFDYTGFDFNLNEPYRNDIWTEPDSAVGIGLLMYYGYQLTEDEKYLTAAINTMDYMEGYFGSPLYEALMYFGPNLASKLNAFHGTNYDITSFLDDNFNASSIPRGGWGSVTGQWGDYEVNGLFGSDSDGGGYVFSMNTFAAAGAIAPVAQYDSRYARNIGMWLLHLTSNSRYYFATETELTNQSITYLDEADEIDEQIKHTIPYEGIRKSSQGRTPWFGGDPTVYDWALTDFSLYSGAHIGMLGALVEETNVEQILRLDLQATQFFSDDTYPTFLLYNPHDETKAVDYTIVSDEPVDLYDSTSNTRLATGVSDSAEINIVSDQAVVIIEIPTDADITEENNNKSIDGTFISRNLMSVNVTNVENNETVSGNVTLNIALAANYDAKIGEVTVEIDDALLTFISDETIEINTKDFSEGNKRLNIMVKTTDGAEDSTTLRLKFE